MSGLNFEKPITDLEVKIAELKGLDSGDNININPEIKKLEAKLDKLRAEVYKNLTPWQRVQIARHPQRPYTSDYIRMIAIGFVELHGDRLFSDDLALIAGFATIDDTKVLVLGHQKGRDTKENVERNFGCAHPEGYRKAIRVMQLAEKFNLPIIIFIDTPGAYPGIGAEERGQAQAIASNLKDMIMLSTPIIAVVIGEGGSGGALGIGVTDRVCILENAYYSVISPEGCASILWRSAVKAPEAAQALKLTGEDLIKLGVIDEIIPEPCGGAHRNEEETAANVKKTILKYIKELSSLSKEELLNSRYEKFRNIGFFTESSSKSA